jgi:hypothetical protein
MILKFFDLEREGSSQLRYRPHSEPVYSDYHLHNLPIYVSQKLFVPMFLCFFPTRISYEFPDPPRVSRSYQIIECGSSDTSLCLIW